MQTSATGSFQELVRQKSVKNSLVIADLAFGQWDVLDDPLGLYLLWFCDSLVNITLLTQTQLMSRNLCKRFKKIKRKRKCALKEMLHVKVRQFSLFYKNHKDGEWSYISVMSFCLHGVCWLQLHFTAHLGTCLFHYPPFHCPSCSRTFNSKGSGPGKLPRSKDSS